jgi:hypothetical protein
MLAGQGITTERWQALAAAVSAGDESATVVVLDELEHAAAEAGVDGLTVGHTRQYRQLPGSGSAPVAVAGWSQCPHARPCSRVHRTGHTTSPVCAISGDAFTPVSVTAR